MATVRPGPREGAEQVLGAVEVVVGEKNLRLM
jgi:hypothetical protein